MLHKKPALESDAYRMAFSKMSSQVMSLGEKARAILYKHPTEFYDIGRATEFIVGAYDALENFEDSEFGNKKATAGLWGRIMKIEDCMYERVDARELALTLRTRKK